MSNLSRTTLYTKFGPLSRRPFRPPKGRSRKGRHPLDAVVVLNTPPVHVRVSSAELTRVRPTCCSVSLGGAETKSFGRVLGLREIEAIEVHDLVPRGNEVTHELLFRV